MAVARSSVLIFGGRGFVGSCVGKELISRGIPVLSVGRSAAEAGKSVTSGKIEQRTGVDALKPETYESMLSTARAVVVAVGEAPWTELWGKKERAVRMNGITNVSVLEAAAKNGVPRVVLVNATMPQWGLISGYREGKQQAEAAALKYPEQCSDKDCGVLVLKPGVVSGTRYVGKIPLPLWLMFVPVRLVMKLMPGPFKALERMLPGLLGGVLSPPVHVEELAKAAADAIVDEGFRGIRTLEPDKLVGYGK
eukprot:gnl/MRDRNA2_/MRDRNA2_27147_c0_seq2.p1 gnl/MRDRNA2_/MRDRNA2_27147_c0~~gnl/MRDRNA2_/MRDRNA2_27147_c0_seq2.p1  ORF type:complete len:251 (-),score=59.43 gnl/MRDRNA2_/MRDRNA2_27147_c0_seq2:224-976(-)